MAYGQLGRAAEARASIEEIQRLNPNFSSATARSYVSVFYVQEKIIEHWLDGLRKAGLGGLTGVEQ
jgi:hypothetical protein